MSGRHSIPQRRRWCEYGEDRKSVGLYRASNANKVYLERASKCVFVFCLILILLCCFESV